MGAAGSSLGAQEKSAGALEGPEHGQASDRVGGDEDALFWPPNRERLQEPPTQEDRGDEKQLADLDSDIEVKVFQKAPPLLKFRVGIGINTT